MDGKEKNKMKTVKIAEREVNALTKEELLALGYEEFNDTMRKKYPAGSPLGREVGIVIFHAFPWNTSVYDATDRMMTLFYYKRSWDASEFIDDVAKAVHEYRADMEKLGIPEEPEEGEKE